MIMDSNLSIPSGFVPRSQFQGTSVSIDSARLYRFSIGLDPALIMKHTTLNQRDGLILILEDENGYQGISEISPLPGFSEEAIDNVQMETTLHLEKLTSGAELLSTPSISDVHHELNHPHPALAIFGIETAILALQAQMHDVSPGELILGESSTKVPINGLINGSLSDWVNEAKNAVEAGFQTLKIKVGRINSELEARGIQEIRSIVGPDVKLRLDANQSWDLLTAVTFGKMVASSNIEYIEEPLQVASDLPRFFDACGLPFAFDETMYRTLHPGISFDAYTGLKALVLKPTLIASSSRLMAMIHQAHEKGVSAILSSSYESDVGLNFLAQLAGSIGGEKLAVGLDTGSIFSAGTTIDRVKIEKGMMSLKAIREEDLDLTHCELIYES